MQTITPEVRRAVAEAGHARIEDPETRETYVVLKADAYDRIRQLLGTEEDALSVDQQKHLLGELGRSIGWGDPAMDVYDQP